MPSRSPCAYCSSTSYHISQCADFKALNKQQVIVWIKENKRCWRCARPHVAAKCTLNRACNTCKRRHLQILCEINNKSDTHSYLVNSTAHTLYLDRPSHTGHVLLKLVKVILRNGSHTLETFALLDDRSERTILLQSAAHSLHLDGKPGDLALRTVRQGVDILQGATVQGTVLSFKVSSASSSSEFHINHAFNADRLALSEHTHPVLSLQRKYKHLCGLPLTPMHQVTPLLLIGSDHNHLISPHPSSIWPIRSTSSSQDSPWLDTARSSQESSRERFCLKRDRTSPFCCASISPSPLNLMSCTKMWNVSGNWMKCPIETKEQPPGPSWITRQ